MIIIICVLISLNLIVDIIAARVLSKRLFAMTLYFNALNKRHKIENDLEKFDCPPFPQDDDKADIGDPALQPTIQEQGEIMNSINRLKEWIDDTLPVIASDGTRRAKTIFHEDIERLISVAEKKMRPFNG